MKNYFLSLIVIAMLFVVACGGNEKKDTDNGNDDTEVGTDQSKTAEYDLSSNEIPVIVTGPAGAEVSKGMGNAEMDGERTINYQIVKDNFKLDVTYTTGGEYTKEEVYATAKEITEEEEGFVEFISKDEDGFIYKLKTDDGDDYGFSYIYINNKKEPIEFGKGFSLSNFTLDQIKELYEAAKTAKLK